MVSVVAKEGASLLTPSSTVKSSPWRQRAFIAAGVCVALLVGCVIYPSRPATPEIITSSFPVMGESSSLSSLNTLEAAPMPAGFDGDLRKRCKETYFEQTLDHFDAVTATYQQRYFVCSEFWNASNAGPIFFYVGNEADVELYLNHTGLMWENAQEFGAMMVFAEHRFFGKSVPFGSEARQHLRYLSSEQALADYAVLIRYLKETLGAQSSAVIGFGGSYGGMLGTWFRLKYPFIIDGVVAGSAPILSFLGEDPPMDPDAYSKIVTFDATPEAGSSRNCVANIKRSWDLIFEAGNSAVGRAMLQSAFGLCDPLNTTDDAYALANWIKSAYDYLAMGNYPYPSSYIMNGASVLPAYPVRVACSQLAEYYPISTPDEVSTLLTALRASVNVYYNSTNDVLCHSFNAPSNASQMDADFWDYLWCSELYQPQDQGVNDMYWTVLHNQTEDAERCWQTWGVKLRPTWAQTVYGGRKALKTTSNIVFSNGNYDPWSGTGVLESISDSVVAVKVDGGAHHLDLMFSNPLDSESVKQARLTEKAYMWQWVKEAAARNAKTAILN